MSKRLLFCVETTKKANTDYAYIKETVNRFYVLSEKDVLRSIPMNSRTRYNSKSVQMEIQRKSGLNDTHVIYCIDTDRYDTSPEDKALLEQIKQYCGNSVPDTRKPAAVKHFRTSRAIEHIKASQLEKAEYQRHCSNILKVLDLYLERKE